MQYIFPSCWSQRRVIIASAPVWAGVPSGYPARRGNPHLVDNRKQGIHLRRDSEETTIMTENMLKPGPLAV